VCCRLFNRGVRTPEKTEILVGSHGNDLKFRAITR